MKILCVLATEAREGVANPFSQLGAQRPAGVLGCRHRIAETKFEPLRVDASFSRPDCLDAAAQVTVDGRAVTLAAYDVPYPEH